MNVIGLRGDAVRQVVVNRAVAAILSHFANKSVSAAHLARPQSVIRRALEMAASPVVGAADDDLEALFRWQDDAQALRHDHPNIPDASLWDLGCGSAHLGRWLTEHGVAYLGVEPSADLVAAAACETSTGGCG